MADDRDGFGDGVTPVAMPHGLASDPILLVVEREGDEGSLCDFLISCDGGGESASANEEVAVAESEWGELGVRFSFAVIVRAEEEEEGEDFEVGDGLVNVEGEWAGQTRVEAGSSLRYLAS